MATVYLIHLDTPLAHAQHYLGFTKRDSPLQRLRLHRAGGGAKMLAACNRGGIRYHVVRIWREQTRTFERSLKKRKDARQLCPVCNPRLPRETRYRFHRY